MDRKSVKELRKDTSWTFRQFLLLAVPLVIILFVIGFGLRSVGILGSTVVERAVFENSYQRSASLRARIAQDEAVLIEIEGKLSNPNLDENTRFNLKAHASATRVRIASSKGEQK